MLDNTRLRGDLAHIQRSLATFTASERGKGLADHLTRAVDATTAAVLWQALFADCLRVAYTAAAADGKVGDDEITALYEFLFSVARHYANVLPEYREFIAIDEESTRTFLSHYANDGGVFGERATMHWTGLTLCRRAADRGEPEPLERYERMMSWLVPEACKIGGVTENDPRWGPRVAEIYSMRKNLAEAAAATATVKPTVDPRLRVFLSGVGVFAGVQQASSVFETDPFDVEKIHQDVRTSFEQMVERATAPEQHGNRGRILLVLGESGAGKTHLMRDFRRHVHEYGRGFVAYAQMNTSARNYSRYLLHHVIDSLSRPYTGPSGERSGLRELASGLGRLVDEPLRKEIEATADGDWEAVETLQERTMRLANALLQYPALSNVDPDLLRVLLFALHPAQGTTPWIYKYLRCEPIAQHDQAWLGGISPKTDDEHPAQMIRDIARLAFLTRRAALVLMVDQAELSGYDPTTGGSEFKRAIDALYSIVSEVPSAIAVVACLSDLYEDVRRTLSQPMVDRLEKDPPFERLQLNRPYSEIEAIVGRRLSWLYSQSGVAFKPEEPVFPIPPSSLRNLTNRRTRDILYWCHQFQSQCVMAKKLVDITDVKPSISSPKNENDLDRLTTEWNDHCHDAVVEIPDEDDELLDAIVAAAKAVAAELGLSLALTSRRAAGLHIKLSGTDQHSDMLFAVTNRKHNGGAFSKQLEQLRTAASKTAAPVAVRTIEFPPGAGSVAAIGQLIKSGGRRAYLDGSTLRALMAFQTFKSSASPERFLAWQVRDRPISTLPPMNDLFDLARISGASAPPIATDEPSAAPQADATADKSGKTAKSNGKRPSKTPPQGSPSGSASASATATASATAGSSSTTAPNTPNTPRNPGKKAKPTPLNGHISVDTPLHVGTAATISAEPRTIDASSMLRHTGILGSSGSGKTTLALNLIEQLLERDVAVILVDRKGDLAGYAKSDWWKDTSNPDRAKKLAARTDVRLFTPGTGGGRPLALSLIPDLRGIPDHERNRMVTYAADALASMMDADTSTHRAILAQAIAVLAEAGKRASLDELVELIESRDDQLMARASRYEDKHFKKLVEQLETIRLRDGHLFDPKAEQLTTETLISRGPDGKVPLSIISTRFLGEIEHIQSWVAHLVACLGRYAAQSPSTELRVVFMLDEADIFMPAGSLKPPSKEPLQDLLKRARSAGLGIVLSSQSPADFDYRSREQINTWFLGRIADQRSIDKMKPLFEHKPAVGGKLGTQDPGRFVLLQDGAAGDLSRTPSLLHTAQIAEPELMVLAAQNRGTTGA